MDLRLDSGCKKFRDILESPVSMDLQKVVDQDSVEKSIRTIQSKIDNLVACQQALRGVHNTLVPISRLPREVLGHIIFDLVVHGLSDEYCRPSNASPVELTHVCRDWRQLAIATPALWTKPPLYRPKLAEMMMNRVGRMPLSLWINVYHLDIVMRHEEKLPRLRDLTLTAISRDFPKLMALFTTPLPLLKTLAIKCVSGVGTLHEEFLARVAVSRLNHLTLDGCYVPWSSDIFRGLTSLSVTDKRENSPMTHMELLSILRESPGIVELELLNAMSFLEKANNSVIHNEPLVLPKLETLSISGRMHQSTLSHILSSIQAPRLSSIKLPEIISDTDFNIAVFAIRIRTFLANINTSLYIRAAEINCYVSDGYVTLRNLFTCARDSIDQSFDLKLNFEYCNFGDESIRAEDLEILSAALLESLPTAHLQELAVSSDGELAGTTELNGLWRAISTLPELRSFTVTHGESLGVQSSLLTVLATPGVHDGSQFTAKFPALTTFTWTSSWHKPYRKARWRKAFSAFVQTLTSSDLSEKTCATYYTLHQKWSATNAGRKDVETEAKVRVYGSEVTGEFKGFEDSDNEVEYVVGMHAT